MLSERYRYSQIFIEGSAEVCRMTRKMKIVVNQSAMHNDYMKSHGDHLLI